MSLLSRDRILALVGAQEIALVRTSGMFKAAVVDAENFAFTESAQGLAVASRLESVLNDTRWMNAPIHVVIDDSFARYAVVPWSGKNLASAAKEAHARFVLTDLFGADIESWRIALEDSPPGHDSLASCMPADLIEALQVLVTNGLRLESIQPLLVAAFNGQRSNLRGDQWLATWASGYLTAAKISDGRIASIETRRAPRGPLAELEKVLAFGALLGTDAVLPPACRLIGVAGDVAEIGGVAIEYLPAGDESRPTWIRTAEMLCA